MVSRNVYQKQDVIAAVRTYWCVKSFRKASSIVKIPKSTIHSWVHRFEHIIDRGFKHRKKRGRYTKTNNVTDILRQLTTFDSLVDVQMLLREQSGYTYSLSSCCRFLRLMGMTRKKVSWRIRPYDVTDRKKTFAELMSAVQSSSLVSLDECGFSSQDNIKYAYGLKGAPISKEKKEPQRFRNSCIAMVDTQGIVAYEVFSDSVNKSCFVDFAARAFPKCQGKTILLDNISFHHSKEVKEIARTNNVTLIFTPPYSPEFNPIEYFFHQVKSCARKHFSSTRHVTKNGFQEQVAMMFESFLWSDLLPTFESCLRRCKDILI